MPPLDEYRRKRRFDRTPEPSGEPTSVPTENTFVVQKHAARRLHWDFRLAINGALKSWAVPKGPSLNPADKRLAVMTEDHPLDYANFEGKIPEGSYGAGTVMVWDRGTFALEGHGGALQQIEKGEIKFSLSGEKLRGSFALVKLRNSEKGNDWLMLKHKDASVDTGWDVEKHDGSVLTGRTLEEIKEEAPPKRSAAPIRASELHGAKKAPMPMRIEPMLPTLVEKPFSDPKWLFELKWDGVRAIAWINGSAKNAGQRLTIRARSGSDITARYPELAALSEFISARQAILDGEIAALDERGRGDFEKLQQRMHVRAPSESVIAAAPVVFYLFDILYCDGCDLRQAPLIERKQFLRALLRPSDRFRYSDHQAERGTELFELAKQNQLEGIVGKRADSIYASGRSTSWLKMKSTTMVDAVIGGCTESPNTGLRFGSLLLGLYQGPAKGKKLQFIGHVGSGFDQKMQEEIFGKMKEHATSACPFDSPPKTNEKASWIAPALVARVRFTGWTRERSLRNPVFLGLREDIQAPDCKWENEIPSSPDVVTAPPAPDVVGRVLSTKAQIEAELFKGRSENVVLEIEGKRFRLSNLNKVYFPESGYTKRDLIAYYYRMADYLLPFLKDRPLVLRRYPDGIRGQAFFQKDVREGLPDWFQTVPIESEGRGGETIHYALASDKASVLFLTGLGCIDHNPWSSRVGNLHHPDYFFFDLDPSDGTEFSVVVKIARALREKLDELEVESFIKTSGATGIHIYVPIAEGYTYEQARTFGEIVARLVGQENRNFITSERIVSKRPAGRVLIDISQNAYGRPLAAPYAVRAFPKAPVSTPLSPRELRPTLKPESLNVKTVFSRLEKQGDLWRDFWNRRQSLERPIELLSARMDPKSTK
jgi:bifunctional non-homologous end joining protein LigD